MRFARRLAVGFFALVVALSVVTGVALRPAPPGTARGGGGPGFPLPGLAAAVRALVGGGSAGASRQEGRGAIALARNQPTPPGVVRKPAHRVRELIGRRTATTRVFAMSDGTMQAEVSAAPRFYRDGHGAWQPINTAVAPSRAGGYVFANTTNTFTSRFGGTSDRLVSFGLAGQVVRLGLSGPARPVRAVASRDTVTYPDIVPGVDLSFQVTSQELKQRLVLRSAPAAAALASLAFTLDAGSLRVSQRRDGSIALRTPVDDRVLLVLPAPYMIDSHADAASPYGFSYSSKITQALGRAGGGYTVTVAADRSWLSAPARVYPVTVDPTIKIQPTPSQAQDAMIVNDDPNGNYDSSWRLSVGTTDTEIARSLIKFDLSTIPANTQISSASLQMYFDQDFYASNYDVPIEARQVTSPWDASTVTWNSINTAYSTGAATVVTVDDTNTANIAVKGTWPASTSSLTQYGIDGTYRYDKDNTTGDTFTWIPNVPAAGTYTVEAHYVAASDRTTAAQYTTYYNGGSVTTSVNQQGPGNADWASLGTHNFAAGTAGKVVLSDANASSTVAVIADAVRLTQAGAVKLANQSSVWHSYPVTNLVQSWVNGTANYGFMLKAADEATMGHGGPRYEASEYAYNGEYANAPTLLVNYGEPGVTLDPPSTIYDTGAALHWSAYTGSDIAEYQVHRSIYQTFTPSAATLVAPVDKNTTSFTDTTATPTPVDSSDPFGQVYYYMVVVKTTSGQLISSPTQIAALPRAGRVQQIIRGATGDTTLSSAQPGTNENVLAGNPWLMVGNSSTTYGTTRAVLKWDTSSIPADAHVLNAYATLWETTMASANSTGTASYEMHALTRDFDQSTATWNSASSGTAWTTAGGDYDPTPTDSITSFTNDPSRRSWDLTGTAQNWVGTPSTNHGVLLKLANESTPQERTIFLSSEGAEPMLRPKLVVNYTEPLAERTYYAPSTTSMRMIPGDQYTIPVTINNPTTGTWAAADWELSYHWALPDGTDATTGGNQLFTPLPSDVAAGTEVQVNANIKTPVNSDPGNKALQYILKWELYNKTTNTWLSASSGIGTLDQPVTVDDPTSDQLGMEKFYQYAAVPTGGGGAALVNAHAGNVAWGYNAFSNPGRGLNTSVRMTYNSLDTSDSSMGFGWSLSASTLTRLGSPLQFSPPGQSWPSEVDMTDGDGTTHQFILDKHNSTDTSVWDYDHPAGVHLYLQNNSAAGDSSRAWVMTAPDRTQFFFDSDGYPTAVVDHTGNNTQTYTYADRRSQNEPDKFLQYITDPSGRQTLTLSYYAKGDSYSYIDDTGNLVSDTNLTNPKIIDQVKSITDVGGRTVDFYYTTEGLMARMVDGAGQSVAKTFNFGYDMTQGNKNVKLVKVTDPRGNSTSLTYYDPPTDPQFHWWVDTITSRTGGVATFGYTDPDGTSGSNVVTSLTDPDNNVTTYTTDGYGRVTAMTNALNQTSQLSWDADNNVTQMVEANGATTNYTYDANTGYPLSVQDAEATKNGWSPTTLTYNTGLNGHIADLATKTSSLGNQWAFGYDSVGDLTSVTDPDGTATSTAGDYTTSYTYDSYGQLQTAKDADGNTTTYSAFDPTGYPKTITDALGNAGTTAYDVWGHVTSVTDPLGRTSTYDYDIFGRPLDSKVPKDQAAGVYITTPAPVYDANDNVTQSTAPNGAVTTAVYDAGDRVTSVTSPKDTSTSPDRVTSYTYDQIGNLLTETQPDGNLTTTSGDYTTTLAYDAIYEETSTTDAAGNQTSYSYDNVGNRTMVVDPLKNLTSDTTDYTTKYAYDLDHRAIQVTDAAGHSKSTTYDHDGRTTATTDEDGNTTTFTLDARGDVLSQSVPHSTDSSGNIVYDTTKYVFDQAGNQTQTISPRGVASGTSGAFVTQTTYDADNRVASQVPPYDPNDSRYNTPHPTNYSYDADGRLAKVSAPPSDGQTVRNDTSYTYFDNGWAKSSTDPWNILTSYDYNDLGQQTSSTLTSDGGSSSRTMTWSYYPSGNLASRSDSGVPVGLQVVLADNSDAQSTTITGTWPTSSTAGGYEGYDYATHAAGTGTNMFTWNLVIPEDGNYTAYVRYAGVSGAASNASYTVNYNGGSASTTVDQTANAGTWVKLGTYAFSTAASGQAITLSDNANGTVVADAVKLVRDNSADTDNEQKSFSYTYDANGNLTDVADNSSGALIDDYAVSYTGLNQVASVAEKLSGVTKHTTSFTYDADGNTTGHTHDAATASYTYDVRNLLSKVTDAESANDPSPKVTTLGYTPSGQVATETKGNGNVVTSGYFLDGALSQQVEKKADGTLVSQHDYTYDADGNTLTDAAKTMNADDHSAYINETTTNTYNPLDQVATSTKSGDHPSSESYVYDPNNNIVSQTVGGNTTTSSYDRNRLQTTSVGGITSDYNYDPFGRLDNVTTGGSLTAKYTYDGFDRIASEQNKVGTGLTTTNFSYDPFDRTASQTANVGTSTEKTTTFQYLAMSKALVAEQVNGTTTKTYTYSPWGERLSQVVHNSDGTEDPTYYSYNAHSDVEAVTDASGNTKATYGYTAYGQADNSLSTGADKPDSTNPTKEPYNAYRFNADRWDVGSGTYNMGFRTYDPGLNRFLTRDMYAGALADMNLITDPWTGNRYAFAGGNPITNIELDGHGWLSDLGHAALDVAGMIPVVGAVADVANGVWYAAEGDYLDAGLSLAGAIPVIGDAALGAKYAIKGAKYAVEGVEVTKDLVHGAEAADDLVKDAKTLDHLTNDANDLEKVQQQAAAARKLEQEQAAARRVAEEQAAAARAQAKAEAAAEKTAGEVAVDTNVVSDALGGGRSAAVDAALNGRAPVLSPQANRELLNGGYSAEDIAGWLAQRGGRMGPEATQSGIDAIQNGLRAMWRGKSFRPMIHAADAAVLDSAAQEGLSLITNDAQLSKNAARLGYAIEGY